MSIVIENPNPEDHLRTEWLLTNGLGGYAMGTVLGVNTRRYHGLLVAATKPPVGRVVALHSMIEQLVIPRDDGTEEVIDLSTQMFVGPDGEPILHPDGWKRLSRFELHDGECVWVFEAGPAVIYRRLRFPADPFGNDVRISYDLESGRNDVRLRARPMVALRDHHACLHDGMPPAIDRAGVTDVTVHREDDRLELSSHSPFREDVQEWRRYGYVEDRARGLGWVEHLWSPGIFDLTESVSGDRFIRCIASGPQVLTGLAVRGPVDMRDHFVVTRSKSTGRSIIAGYPWFADWGRDAMIALPGLLLSTMRFDEARRVLETFARHMKNGLIPNRFDDDGGEAHYNTVDASLWFVYAVWQYWQSGKNDVGELLDACKAIIRAYRSGTDFNIRMDSDGLIAAGDETTQLTWMDAKRDGVVFTPRHGKAVEVNALWFNALICLSEMMDLDDEANDLRRLASRVGDSFRARYWWAEDHGLHDVLQRDDEPDGKLRPNQIFSVSLPHSPLETDQQRSVVHCVGERFLTPFGLRTLDRADPDYQPRYEGDLFARDRAYHNGTVWPWLIGPYCEAVLRVNGFSAEAKRHAGAAIGRLLGEMEETTGARCLGQVAEVYDGDAPHRPSGCTAQAWSVAEVLRIRAMLQE